tara:strand:- start:375426 stop:376367 length:942 start_codon:yes stop_codon:yes gene_type:complete
MSKTTRPALIIHGGAGYIIEKNLSAEDQAAFHQALEESLNAGWALINNGADAVDGVIAAIKVLEDCPLFDAAVGSCIASDGSVVMSASLMDGRTLDAGGIALSKHIKNPIMAAKLAMDKSPHTLLAGSALDEYARENHIEMEENTYFKTDLRWQQYLSVKDGDGVYLDHDLPKGTVGAVAIDCNGHIAAGTSTGGLTNQHPARVPDSAIIGAGTYANDHVGISCTGTGDMFIKAAVAKTIANSTLSYKEAVAASLQEVIGLGGEGGLIAITYQGEIIADYTTAGMYHGIMHGDLDKPQTSIFITPLCVKPRNE